jgi:5'-methylthioadenosine phosphorylase
MNNKTIGIIGGTGLYTFFDDIEEKWIDTPYGKTSDKIAFANHEGKEIVFLPRHGKTHNLPPHKINYLANIWALKSLNVTHIISATAAGSLQKNIKPGDFVICNQFIDKTKNRQDTFYNGPKIVHIGGVEPYCQIVSDLCYKTAKKLNLPCHKTGTAVVIEGPRFSTSAESKHYTNMGWEVINMTQYPEVVLARELEMCYSNISLITDYDSGFEGEKPSIDIAEAIKIFKLNTEKMQNLILKVIEQIDLNRICSCHTELERAKLG